VLDKSGGRGFCALRVAHSVPMIQFFFFFFWLQMDGRAMGHLQVLDGVCAAKHVRGTTARPAQQHLSPPTPLFSPITHHTTIPCILSLQPGSNSSLPAPACLAPWMRPRLLIHPRFARPHPARAPVGSCGRFTMHLSIPSPLHCLPERQTCRVWSTCGSRNGEGGSGGEEKQS
jgi:hypothetical protein